MAGVFKGAALSFFSGHFYGETARQRKGVGLAYVFLLTLFMTATVFLSFVLGDQYQQARAAIGRLPEIADSLPSLTVTKDGILSIDKPVPYTVTMGSPPDDTRVVVDTNYKITDINALEKYMQQNRIIAMATADKLIMRDVHGIADPSPQVDNTLRISELKEGAPFSFTHDNWRELGVMVASWGMPALLAVFFAGMLLGFFVANFLATLFSGVVIMLVDMAAKTDLEFSAALRLAAALRIPVVILAALPTLVGMNPLTGLSGWILWGLYIVFAVWSVRLYSKGRP